MNKPDLDIMAIDDLYNNFKIVEQQVRKAVATNSNIQNMAFVSTLTNSTKLMLLVDKILLVVLLILLVVH